MRLIKTKDGSYTFYSDKYKETYHSVTGALEESHKKFVEPCNIKDGMTVLDICFGLGYNSAVALSKTKKLRVIALEKDRKILNKTKDIKVLDWLKEYSIIKKVAKDLEYKDNETYIKIILGDATSTIKKLREKFDAVFLDPFSPPKNPELWTEEFLKDVVKRMNKNAILTTYSCARLVRINLQKAGLVVKDGPIVGRRGPSTIAIKR